MSLAVVSAEWFLGERYLIVEAAVANATDGAPAPLVWTAFTLETDGGAILDAHLDSAETCPGGLSVALGATLRCEVAFDDARGAWDCVPRVIAAPRLTRATADPHIRLPARAASC